MSFTDRFLEKPEAERARLAAAPEGSKSHALSLLPVTITGPLRGRVIRLPPMSFEGTDDVMVVVPYAHTGSFREHPVSEEHPVLRYAGSWECVVVASSAPRYTVGGHHLSVTESELVRGQLVDMEFSLTREQQHYIIDQD